MSAFEAAGSWKRGFSRRKDKVTVAEMAIESGCRMCDRLPATAEPRDGVRYS